MIQYCITDLKSAQAVIKLMLKHDPDLQSVGVPHAVRRGIRQEVYKAFPKTNPDCYNGWRHVGDRYDISPVTYINGVMVYGKD
jgi:hypothetical protein